MGSKFFLQYCLVRSELYWETERTRAPSTWSACLDNLQRESTSQFPSMSSSINKRRPPNFNFRIVEQDSYSVVKKANVISRKPVISRKLISGQRQFILIFTLRWSVRRRLSLPLLCLFASSVFRLCLSRLWLLDLFFLLF